MLLKKLHIRNFKSIREAEIHFSPLTIAVGANAAGKSNLVSVFRFLSDILTQGVETAVALQGGIRYLVNATLPRGTPVEVSFTLDVSDEGWFRNPYHMSSKNDRPIWLEYKELTCSFSIQPTKQAGRFRIVHDELQLRIVFSNEDATAQDNKLPSSAENADILYERHRNARVQYRCDFLDSLNPADEQESLRIRDIVQHDLLFLLFTRKAGENKKELLLSSAKMLLPPIFSEALFIRTFDFEPKELKRPCPIASPLVLREDGSNLAAVLQPILNNKKKNAQFTALLNEYLPFTEKVAVESSEDKSFSYKVRETYGGKIFQQNFLSDGTVSILAILTAMYFQEQSILILEEPERNLHPRLLSTLLSSAEDVSTDKQVILTTHNPELLKHAKIDTVLLVSRDADGFTFFSKPKDSKMVQTFLQNDLGLDDLFLQDLLGA